MHSLISAAALKIEAGRARAAVPELCAVEVEIFLTGELCVTTTVM
jgi:hypothetical protein